MLKLLLTGVWVAGITLGSVYLSMRHASAPVESSEEQARLAVQEYLPGEMITVPVLRNGGVQGYFLTKLSFAVDKTKVKTLQVPFKETVTNALFDILVGKQLINVEDKNSFDLANFKSAVKTGLNEQMKNEVVFEVLVEQLEYLSKTDVARVANPEGRKQPEPVAIVDRNGDTAHDVIPGAAEKIAAGH
ncbi:hypothetical protein [Rhizobium sp. Leaf341]|uniref:hypothetical protein n=1 Tax=Rhizobium sp. Leaf341 TaxID=1736344 RepID=UPI000712CC43|nr:hypothetical protein [Rhizobium sp. Leaf341]KQR77723.1 hypothetical protein ASG03_15175 [Rhizobium sp. Leaf341]